MKRHTPVRKFLSNNKRLTHKNAKDILLYVDKKEHGVGLLQRKGEKHNKNNDLAVGRGKTSKKVSNFKRLAIEHSVKSQEHKEGSGYIVVKGSDLLLC